MEGWVTAHKWVRSHRCFIAFSFWPSRLSHSRPALPTKVRKERGWIRSSWHFLIGLQHWGHLSSMCSGWPNKSGSDRKGIIKNFATFPRRPHSNSNAKLLWDYEGGSAYKLSIRGNWMLLTVKLREVQRVNLNQIQIRFRNLWEDSLNSQLFAGCCFGSGQTCELFIAKEMLN